VTPGALAGGFRARAADGAGARAAGVAAPLAIRENGRGPN